MLREERTAILFTANTLQVTQAGLMLSSLRDPDKGNFKGDLWVISTGLSERAKDYLDSMGIKYLVSPLNSVKEKMDWKRIAECQPEYETLLETKSKEESQLLAFDAYRNKRLSKLIILDWMEKVGASYDFIALCDSDLYFQRDVHVLFEQYYNAEEDRIYYWHEENPILYGTGLWYKNYYYSMFYDTNELDFGKNEINIGFIMGMPGSICRAFKEVRKNFLALNSKLFTQYKWHDQDLIRLDRARNPERYSLVREGSIVHLCNGGKRVVEEKYPQAFYHVKTGEMPWVIHFAGGMWKGYEAIENTYQVNRDFFFASQESKKEYDMIREKSFQNLFDVVNHKYYTEKNKQSKTDSRKRWIELSANGKKKIMFAGWPDKEEAEKIISEFNEAGEYNVVAILKNSEDTGNQYLLEDIPTVLTDPSFIIGNSYLVKTYGFHLPHVPEWLYEEATRAAIAEFDCTVREATAVVSLTYLYFSESIDFYRPDQIYLFGCGPQEKLIKDICSWKNIPISFVKDAATLDRTLGQSTVSVVTKNTEEPMVSVIMPVYNAGEYLAACINSICRQTLESLELICINNGSTDDSQKVLDYFAAQDSRIKVHYQKEPNQRMARNTGFDHARGKYVYLIDSDDYLDINALEKLVEAAEKTDADLLYFFFREVRTDLQGFRPRPRWLSFCRFFPQEKIFKMDESYFKFFIQYPFPWAKLIRRDLIINKKLYFDLDCENFDDNPHNLRTLFSAQNIYVYNEQFYNFRIHDKSMTQSINPRVLGMIDAVRIMNDIYRQFDCYEKYMKWYVPYKIHIIAWAWNFVPQELKKKYFEQVKGLFYPGEEELFHDDFVYSYLEIPNRINTERVEKMLKQTYEQFMYE